MGGRPAGTRGVKEDIVRAAVSAIIVNWNGAAHLQTCLPSLLGQSLPPSEVLIADNGSVDDSERVAESFGAKLLPLGENRGIAAAGNHAARRATGEFLLFLNNDMRFDREFVRTLVEGLTSDGSIFAVDGIQYDWDGSQRVHLATQLGRGAPAGLDGLPLLPGLFLYQEPTAAPTLACATSGANMLVHRERFQALGGFDDRFFAGYEDVDLCWRAWLFGWKSVFLPGAVCWHRVGGSSGSRAASSARFRGTLIGRLVLATKLLPVRYVIATWAATTAGLATDAAGRRFDRLRDRGGLLGRFVHDLPGLLLERRTLYRAAGTTPRAQLERLLGIAAGR